MYFNKIYQILISAASLNLSSSLHLMYNYYISSTKLEIVFKNYSFRASVLSKDNILTININ